MTHVTLVKASNSQTLHCSSTLAPTCPPARPPAQARPTQVRDAAEGRHRRARAAAADRCVAIGGQAGRRRDFSRPPARPRVGQRQRQHQRHRQRHHYPGRHPRHHGHQLDRLLTFDHHRLVPAQLSCGQIRPRLSRAPCGPPRATPPKRGAGGSH